MIWVTSGQSYLPDPQFTPYKGISDPRRGRLLEFEVKCQRMFLSITE